MIFIHLFFSVDSVMLLEHGFNVTSTDASDKMLKHAWKIRWARRKEIAFDSWGEFNLFGPWNDFQLFHTDLPITLRPGVGHEVFERGGPEAIKKTLERGDPKFLKMAFECSFQSFSRGHSQDF